MKTAAAEKNQVASAAETAVDFPVGVVLSVGDRVTELAEPWSSRAKAEKQIKAYRTQLRKTLKRTERRGHSARRKATTDARKRQRSVESTLKSHRDQVGTTLKTQREQVSGRAQGLTSSAQGLVTTVTDQISALR